MALSPVEFIRRFMLHVLPEGFFKIRYYGILSNRNKKEALKRCHDISGGNMVKETEILNLEEQSRLVTWICPKCKVDEILVKNIRAAPT